MIKKSLVVLLAVLLMFGSFAAIPIALGAIKNPGHLIVDTIGMPETVDPAWSYDTASGTIIFNVYDVLIWNKVDTTADQKEAGDMYSFDWHVAESCNNIWPNGTIKEPGDTGFDELAYTFTIRSGIPWHDGTYGTVSATDVEYSFERVMIQDRSGGPEWMLYEPLFGIGIAHADPDDPTWGAQVDSKVTVSGSDVTFHLAQAYPPFLNILTQCWSSIICKDWAIAHSCWNGSYVDGEWQVFHDPSTSPLDTDQGISGDPFNGGYMMGCNAYQFDYWDHLAGEWSIYKFDAYYLGWGARGYNVPDGKFLTRLTERDVEEWSDRKLTFMRGDSDFVYVPRAHTLELAGIPGLRAFYPIGSLTTRCLFFNELIESSSAYIGSGAYEEAGIPVDFFAEKFVRRAFAYLFNQSLFLEEVLLGEGLVVGSVIPPPLKYYNDTIPRYELDIDAAYNEFSQAFGGTLLSTGFTCVLTYNAGNEERRAACDMVASNLAAMCVKYSITNFHVSSQAVDWPTYLGALVDRELAIFTLGWLADYPDAHNFVYPFLHVYGDFSYFQSYNNTQMNTWINTEIVTPDGPARKALFDDIQELYYTDCPSIPLAWAYGRHWERDWVQCWYSNLIYPGVYAYHLYKEIIGSPIPCDISATGSLTDIAAWAVADHGVAELELVYPIGEGELTPAPPIDVHVERTDSYDTPASVDVVVGLLWMNASGYNNHTITLGTVPLTKAGTVDCEKTFYWTWDDPSTLLGDYKVWINVGPIDLSTVYDETPANDEDMDGTITVVFLPGDTNGDAYVEMMDYYTLGEAYGSYPTHPRWNPSCDVFGPSGIISAPEYDGDGWVEMMDYYAVGSYYGDNLGWTY